MVSAVGKMQRKFRLVRRTNSLLLLVILCVTVAVIISSDPAQAVERPFILWNKQDIAAIRAKIETQAWAKAAYKRLIENPDRHEYSWFLHALGQTEPGQTEQWKDSQLPEDLYPLKDVHAYQAGEKPWSVKVIQTCAFEKPSKAKLPKQWYDRKIGVRMSMLPSAGTIAYTAQTPLPVVRFRDKEGKRQYKEVPSEIGGVSCPNNRI